MATLCQLTVGCTIFFFLSKKRDKLTAMLLRQIEQSCEYEPDVLALLAVKFLNLLCVAMLMGTISTGDT